MENAVVIENLSKVYKLYAKPVERVKETFSIHKRKYGQDFYALNNVSFSIAKGSTVGIVGRNGSGKSTLLKMLTGVLQPTYGNIQLNGKVSALLELGAGFNMDFTGRKNIYLNGMIMRIPKEEMDKRVDDILKFADIGDFIDQPVKMYSSGMFVRLAFAVAINVDPDILIVDEALAVGDTRFQLKCMDKFLEFQEAGKTILFVSHDVNSIKRFCERTIWLNQGQLIMDGETDEVTDRYIDFLKSELPITEFLSGIEQTQEQMQMQVTEEMIANVELAEVMEVRMYNEHGKEIADIEHGETVRLLIRYIVNDVNVAKPVLGVAIRSVDHEYICGLNTMLDGKEIPWERGMNQYELVYEGFNLVGGSYYFDVALMDSTATVNLDYKSKIKTFFVKMEYIAEGVVVLNHHWK